MKTCHPERRNCFAKRSHFGVEGPLQASRAHGHLRELSRKLDQRKNAVQRPWQSQGYRDPSTAQDFASRALAPLRMTFSNSVMCNQ